MWDVFPIYIWGFLNCIYSFLFWWSVLSFLMIVQMKCKHLFSTLRREGLTQILSYLLCNNCLLGSTDTRLTRTDTRMDTARKCPVFLFQVFEFWTWRDTCRMALGHGGVEIVIFLKERAVFAKRESDFDAPKCSVLRQKILTYSEEDAPARRRQEEDSPVRRRLSC